MSRPLSVRSAVIAGLLGLLMGRLSAGGDSSCIVIHISEALGGEQASVRYWNGYRKTVSGQSIPYHSSHPDAKEALIARTQTGMLTIAWESDTLGAAPADGMYRLLWLAGIDRGGFGLDRPARTFQLSVDGEPWFTFRTWKDSTAFHWTTGNPNGSTLEFRSDLTDQYGDLFGRMFLTIPARLVAAGKPLRLSVRAENADKPDWFMIMKYSFDFTPGLRAEPVLLRGLSGPEHLLRLTLDELTVGRRISADVLGRRELDTLLALGANAFRLSFPVVSAETTLTVRILTDGRPEVRTSLTVRPVQPRTLFLLPYSHTDIGYTDLQPNVERKQWKNLEEGMALAERTRDYPAGARFKWNLEVLWPLDGWLQQASAEQRERFVRAVRDGSIGLNALYGNELTGLATDVEMSHFFDFARALRREYGLSIETALMSDVPGYSWGMVTALARSGIRWFAVAPNAYDRVGYAYELWGDRPVRWMLQSGQDSVLLWMAGASYSSFHEGTLDRLGDEKIFALLGQLEERHCPYEIVQLPYTTGGDNGPPDTTLPDVVRSWNERYVSPRLVIATHAELFRAFERRYGDSVRSVRGDFTPYWEDGAGSTARETALNRRTVSRLVSAEGLAAAAGAVAFDRSADSAAWKNVVLYDEHTWGAWNSISEPDSPQGRTQWRIKKGFADDADSISRVLLSRVVTASTARPSVRAAIDVFNPSSWNRTDVVTIAAADSRAGDVVVDASGRRVPSQRLRTGDLAFLVKDVPPFGAARYFVRAGRTSGRGRAFASRNTIGTGRFRLAVDERTGAISSLKLPDGAELVDTSLAGGINGYLYLPGRVPDSARGLSDVQVRVQDAGGLVASMIVSAQAPGCRSFEYEIRVLDGLDRIDLIDRLDKLKVRGKESIHIAFPFDLPDATVRFDVAGSIVRVEQDQLGGACKNFFTAQQWADVTGGSRGVTVALVDAPLFEVGGITAEQPWMKMITPSPRILSYALNNYWHTNYKADQEGRLEFRYSLLPHGRFDDVAAVKFSIECREPLIVIVRNVRSKLPRGIELIGSGPTVIRSLRPIDGSGSLLAYLWNPSDSASVVNLSRQREFVPFTSDPDGFPGGRIDGPLKLPARGVQYVLLKSGGLMSPVPSRSHVK